MTQQLAVVTVKDVITEKDFEILKNSKFKGFSQDDILYCAKISNQLALSPFLNQIHFVRRKNKDGTCSIAAQVGIDGFRLAAQRAGGYAGSDDVVFEYGPDKKRPVKATVTVYKMIEGQRCPFTASARWEEFYSPLGGMWDKLPHQMLGKCAEAQALRKAFPADLSGLYAPEEMSQADGPTKAQKVQEQLEDSGALETTGRPLDEPEEPEEIQERIRCQCGSELKASKSGASYFCPNFNDGAKHIRPVPKAQYERSA